MFCGQCIFSKRLTVFEIIKKDRKNLPYNYAVRTFPNLFKLKRIFNYNVCYVE
jgi:hypothetical protein